MTYVADGAAVVDSTSGTIVAECDGGLAVEVAEWLNEREAIVESAVVERGDAELAAVSHRYRDLDGHVLPGVTSVVGLAEEDKAEAFAYVARRLALEGLDHRVEWGYRADLGNRIHSHAERLLGGAAEVQARRDEGGYLDAVERAIDELNLLANLVEVEAAVITPGRACDEVGRTDWHGSASTWCETLHTVGYGGRLDVLTGDAIYDWKTGKPRPMTQTLQLNALNFAEGLGVYGPDGSLMRIAPFEPRERLGCIFLSEDGTYELVEYPSGPEWHAQFMRLLDAKVHNAALSASLKQGRRK